MSAYETINYEISHQGVARITLNRPEKHNAINATMIAELREAVAAVSNDEAVRVVIMSAEGRSFCAGGDLNWMREQMNKSREDKITESKSLARLLLELDTMPKLLVGRIQGNAFGGGVGMMAVCDVIVAERQAKFALTETRLGLIPATIGPYVVRRLGEGYARSLFMNGRVIDAEAGVRVGLVTLTVDAAELDQAIDEEVDLALQCAPGAISDAKSLCQKLARSEVDGPIGWTADRLADRWETKEAASGLASFFERKSAPWPDKREG